jgi:hypothetical protein
MLNEQQFRRDLPSVTFCDECGAALTGIAWNVGRYGPAQWFAIGIAKCECCSRVRVAAAGSDDLAHSYARSVRHRFMEAAKG